MDATYEELAGMIDHAVLKPDQTLDDVKLGCELSKAYGVASACVMSYAVKTAAEIFGDGKTVACCVIGFPFGYANTAGKVAEAVQACNDGAKELDMVCNISAVKSACWHTVGEDIREVVAAGHDGGAKVKVIFETCYLTDDEKRRLCELCTEAKADWVKTSTGFGTGGAVDKDLILMRDHVGEGVQVKASGGIRDLDRLLRVREIGCTRAGASATQALMDAAREKLGLEPIIFDGAAADANKGY
ncbi:MAG: deoxyribose-phosphate aldolase [Planctomycetota bacterium]